MQQQHRLSIRLPPAYSSNFLPQLNTSGSCSNLYSPQNSNNNSVSSYYSFSKDSPRNKVNGLTSSIVLENSQQQPVRRSSFFPGLYDKPVGVQIDSNGTSFTQAPSNYYSRLLPSIQLSHSSRQMDNSTQTLELIDRSNSPRRPIFNLSLQHMDNSPRGISEADEIVHKKRISLRENSILTVIEKQTAAIEKLTERIEKETKKEQRSFEGSLSQQALKLRQSILLGKDFLSQKKIQDEPSPKYSKENFKRKSILKKITNEAALQSLIKLQIENKFKNENNKLNRVTFAEETSVSKAEIFSDSSDGDDEKIKESLSKSRSEPLIHFKIPSQEKSEKELSDSREIRFLNARRPQFNLSLSEDSSQKNSENETEQESLSPKRKKRGTRRVITPGKSKLGIKTIDQGEKVEKIINPTARKNISAILWATIYPKIFSKYIETKVLDKKESIYKTIVNDTGSILSQAEALIISAGEKFLRELVTENKSLELFNSKKPILDKILDVRCNFLFTNIKGFFDKLIFKTTQENLGIPFIKFLTTISENNGVFPKKFMFEFEIKRVQFTHYGTLKNMNTFRSQMILGSFFLLRVLLLKIIMKPWEVFPDIKKGKINRQNLFVIGSILYHSIIGFYKRNVGIQHNNQIFLSSDHKIKSAETIRLKEEEEESNSNEENNLNIKSSQRDKEIEIFCDVLPKEQLKFFFTDRKKQYEEIRALIEGWHSKIYEITHDSYLKM